MSSSDPSQVDSEALKRSLANDLKEAQYAAVREDYGSLFRCWTKLESQRVNCTNALSARA